MKLISVFSSETSELGSWGSRGHPRRTGSCSGRCRLGPVEMPRAPEEAAHREQQRPYDHLSIKNLIEQLVLAVEILVRLLTTDML